MREPKLRIATMMIGLMIFVGSGASLARAEEDEPFVVGGSCASLAYTTTSQLHILLMGSYSDALASFCVPEELFDCSEYSSLLKGAGRLVTGEDGYHCTLQMTHH